MRSSILCRMALGAGLAVLLLAPAAQAQAPPYPPPPPPVAAPPPASPEAAEIAACLCLHRDLDALGADMAAKRQAYDRLRSELAGLDAQLERERATMDVNNLQSVARFRQQLENRDALFRRSTGPAASNLAAAVSQYNARTNEYNARCANKPRDPVLLGQLNAALTCPSPY